MTTRSRTPIIAILATLAAMAALLVAPAPGAGATHPANPYERGPDPTAEDLEAPGPFAFDSQVIPTSQTPGFGPATIYWPVAEEGTTFGGVAIAPGFLSTRDTIAWFGPRLASHGFVVITINTNSILDQPPSRATQLLNALDYLTSPASPVTELVDADRLAVMGHSMGGGGAIQATANRTSIAASIPLTPWHGTKVWPTVETPTLIIGAQNDLTAPVSTHARPLYEGLPDTIAKAYAEFRGQGHFLPNSPNPTVSLLSVAWLKRFVDVDHRYDQFLCPPSDDTVTYSDYRSTCPYTPDSDGDGVADPFDACPGTVLPDEPEGLPTQRAVAASGQRFFADEHGRFVSATGVDSGLTVIDTGGCSASQIAAELGLGQGHDLFGLTRGALEEWLEVLGH